MWGPSRPRTYWSCAVVSLLVISATLLTGCGGGTASTTEASTTNRQATTVGAVTHKINFAKGEFEAVEHTMLAVEFDDGTQAAASASAGILEEAGLGPDVLSGSDERVTWGGEYLILVDDVPDPVRVMEIGEAGSGHFVALTVGS